MSTARTSMSPIRAALDSHCALVVPQHGRQVPGHAPLPPAVISMRSHKKVRWGRPVRSALSAFSEQDEGEREPDKCCRR